VSPTTTRLRPPMPRRLGRRLLGSSLLDVLTGPHGVDRYVELVRPDFSLTEVRAEITDVRHPTADSVTLTLRPNANWQGFRAGQFVRLTVEIDGVQRMRCYSPACSAHRSDGHVELTVKAHTEGLVSQFLKHRAQVGMVVRLSQADGDFFLPERRPARMLLVSGGSGITPVMSMLRTLCDEGHRGPITFLHYAFSEREVAYGPELAALAAQHPNVNLVRAYTEQSHGGELHGYFSREHLAAAEPEYATAETFVCGPPGLMTAVQATWAEERLEERLHVEHFVPPALPTVDDGEVTGNVRFAGSDVDVANDGQVLLEQAEAAGLTPESGCRMGICHSCTCRMTAGTVRNVQTGEVVSGADEDIQICISVPVGDVTLAI
jgi:stearoyl-CoA 9-desaturase NADPH oxidoreductase